MNKFFGSIVLLFFFLSSYSQLDQKTTANVFSDQCSIDQSIKDGTLWFRDSIYYFIGDNDDWKLNEKFVVLERDQNGRMIYANEMMLDSIGKWFIKSVTNVKYHTNGNLADSLIVQWNPQYNDWKDTITHLIKDEKNDIIEDLSQFWAISDVDYKIHKVYKKYKYKYDDKSNEIYSINLEKQDDKNWNIISESFKKYHENGILADHIYHFYGKSGNNNNEPEYFYHIINECKSYNITETIWQYKSHIEDEWVNEKKYLYEFDNKDLVTYEKRFVWSIEKNQWVNQFEGNFLYDDSLLIFESWNEWNNENFQPNSMAEYEYLNNRLIHIIQESYFMSDAKWHDYAEYRYEYNDYGTQILNEFISHGLKTRRNQIFTDSINRFNGSLYQIGDENNNWLNVQKIERKYETTSQTDISQFWNKDIQDWKNSEMSIYKFDDIGNPVEKLYFYWESNNNKWKKESRIIYFWSPKAINANHITRNDEIILYPNPASDEITIENLSESNSDFIIFDQNGIKAKTGLLDKDKPSQININDLISGFYIIRDTESRLFSKKIIITK